VRKVLTENNCICIFAISLNPLTHLTFVHPIAGILVPLAFLFNDAGSQYFQGLLLIIARQPYDIGDCISISDATQEIPKNGSTPWFVENITLFTTTIRSGPSNEVATISNGALAQTRIINAARSHKAQVFIFLKLSIDIPYEKVKIFHNVVREFVKDRPREWIKLAAFRAIRVEADQGYIEYELIAQHVESWQIMGQVLQSRADLSSFCLEVMKQMGMRYASPSMPVNVTIQQNEEEDGPQPEAFFTAHDDDSGSVTEDKSIDGLGLSDVSRLKALSNLFKPPDPPPKKNNAPE
jgi:hypothetical protein